VKSLLRREVKELQKVTRRWWKRIPFWYLLAAGFFLVAPYFALFSFNQYLLERYAALESPAILDRTGAIITLSANSKGQYGRYSASFPMHVKDILVKKEDRFFYWHIGVNPASNVRALYRYALGYPAGGASTISQQLVKNVLGHEQNRTILNKLVETAGAISLELFNSKDSIITMYANSVYMGNQVQGLDAASYLYFGKPLSALDNTKLVMLLSTISSPSVQNPWREANARTSRNLAGQLDIAFDPKLAVVTNAHAYAPPQQFELAAMHLKCDSTCQTTLDKDLTDRLRATLRKQVDLAWDSGARSGAIVVIKLPENQILALVGTPNTSGTETGQQINMAAEARPVGSTIKPFIYLQGFEKGLRPYTLVNDREYKFPIGTGFPLYPKNYDGTYRGWLTLHSALSNSLNVPTVQVLQYVGLQDFYDFLEHDLGFEPLRDLDTYQYGIALGALEMDPLTLAHFLTIFPQSGILRPLQLFESGTSSPWIGVPMAHLGTEKNVANLVFIQLVSKILNDRLSGVEQFGLESNLNLSQDNYAVKTGTSENFHDSWTIGYTPDFAVVVWFGDPQNTQLRHVTGQQGAGAVWRETMEMLLNSDYNKRTPLDFSRVADVVADGNLDIGIPDESNAAHRNLLSDNALIMSPQDGDAFLRERNTTIPLISPQEVSWFSNGEYLGKGERITFSPSQAGDYTITARAFDGLSASVVIHVILKQ